MEYFQNYDKEEMPEFDYQPIEKLMSFRNYIVTEPLRKAVQLAMFLGQPLLLTGEPGTGKTQLAYHLAFHFNPDFDIDNSDGKLPDNFFIFNTKTTSTASDLFYRYEALKHFQYIQNKEEGTQSVIQDSEIERLFLKYQALGKAIKAGKRCIVLIDEIDKAPRDLPNDILNVLEQLEFEVPEINKTGDQKISTSRKNRPIVILTSNSEKNLPDAFLRRCVFYYIPFPDDEVLKEILEKKISNFSPDQLSAAIEHFKEIRKLTKRKMPSTAELLQWVATLELLKINPIDLKTIKSASDQKKADIRTSYSLLIKDKEDFRIVLENKLGILMENK